MLSISNHIATFKSKNQNFDYVVDPDSNQLCVGDKSSPEIWTESKQCFRIGEQVGKETKVLQEPIKKPNIDIHFMCTRPSQSSGALRLNTGLGFGDIAPSQSDDSQNIGKTQMAKLEEESGTVTYHYYVSHCGPPTEGFSFLNEMK